MPRSPLASVPICLSEAIIEVAKAGPLIEQPPEEAGKDRKADEFGKEFAYVRSP